MTPFAFSAAGTMLAGDDADDDDAGGDALALDDVDAGDPLAAPLPPPELPHALTASPTANTRPTPPTTRRRRSFLIFHLLSFSTCPCWEPG